MRIFILNADKGIAPDGTKGASIHLTSTAHALQARGHDVCLCSTRRPQTMNGLDVGGFDSLDDLHGLVEIHGRPDVIHERYSLGSRFGWEFAKELDVPFVLEINAPLVAEAKKHRPDTVSEHDVFWEPEILRNADAVAAVSGPLAKWVLETTGRDNGVHVVPNGFDPARLPKSSPSYDGGRQRVVFLGHPKPWHGVDALVPLLARLREQGIDVELLIVGGGSGADKVEADACQCGLEDFVKVTGPVEAKGIAEAMNGASVALAPYPSQDPFYFCPLKLIEYLGMGLPVVTTAQGDIPAIVGPGGILVPADDEAAFTGAVADLLSDRVRAETMGRAGRTHALDYFTWEQSAVRLEQIYNDALAPEGAA